MVFINIKSQGLLITILDVNGFLFAITTQHPKATDFFNICKVSELAEQSTTTRPEELEEI